MNRKGCEDFRTTSPFLPLASLLSSPLRGDREADRRRPWASQPWLGCSTGFEGAFQPRSRNFGNSYPKGEVFRVNLRGPGLCRQETLESLAVRLRGTFLLVFVAAAALAWASTAAALSPNDPGWAQAWGQKKI